MSSSSNFSTISSLSSELNFSKSTAESEDAGEETEDFGFEDAMDMGGEEEI